MSFQAEQSVLGSVMLDSRAFHRCAAIVSADDFITPEHQTLWRLLALLV